MAQREPMSETQARGVRYARELEGHLTWLDTFSGTALGVLAVASGIYTYLGVSSLLDDNGAMSAFAAIAYSVAVSVGIFVFWSYLLRLFPAVRTTRARMGLLGAMGLGSVAIIAMSSWLNAAALADRRRWSSIWPRRCKITKARWSAHTRLPCPLKGLSGTWRGSDRALRT